MPQEVARWTLAVVGKARLIGLSATAVSGVASIEPAASSVMSSTVGTTARSD